MHMKNVEDVYPLTPMQHIMLFYTISAPQSRVCFEQSSCMLRGPLQVAAFRAAWQQIIDRHPVLRTLFLWENLDEPLQVVRKQVRLPWMEYDWREIPDEVQQERLVNLLEADRAQGFAFSQAPLMRLILVRLAEDLYHFTWSVHHSILDGWSVPLVLQEMFALYNAGCCGQQHQLPSARPYRDYIAWLQQQNISETEIIWRAALKGFRTPTQLSSTRLSDLEGSGEDYAEQHIQLPSALNQALSALVLRDQITLNTIFQSAWAVLLSQWSGSDDVLFGTTVSGRPAVLSGADRMIGMFINILPVRVQIQPASSLAAWLRQLQMQQLELRQYEYTPLIQIREWSEVPWRLPLFESLLVFENYPALTTSAEERGLQIENVQSVVRTNYPLTLLAELGSSLDIHLIYDTRHFEERIIRQLLDHLQRILEAFVHPATTSLADVCASAANHAPLTLPATSVPLEPVPGECQDTGEDVLSDRGQVAPRNTLELQMVQLWEDILQVRPIGVTDNFFTLGGQSLLALRVITHIRQYFGQRLPLTVFAQASTIEQLVQHLQAREEPQVPTPLVALQPRGSRLPFFAVHPGSGNVLCYYDLVRHLGLEQPFYGLQDPFIDLPEFPYVPVVEMAASYIQAMRSIQPHGPYALGGFSYGGIIAFEMACQLQRAGDKVAMLALFDSGTSMDVGEYTDDVTLLAVIAQELLRSFTQKDLPELEEELRQLSSQEQLDYILTQMRVARLELPESGPEWLHQQMQIFRVRVQALERYTPEIYPGQITLFRSTAHLAHPDNPLDDRGWGKLTDQPIKMYRVPGYHDTLISEPGVQVVAQKLRACLDSLAIVSGHIAK